MITIEQGHALYTDNDTAHGFDHVLRVWHMAKRIGEAEGADMRILQAATLLHDIGRAEQLATGGDHAIIAAKRAPDLLDNDYSAKEKRRIATAIRQHRFRTGDAPDTIESQALFDADKLDAIGAVGIARAYAIGGLMHQRLWAEVDPAYLQRPREATGDDMKAGEHTPVHEFQFKLVKLKERLYTATGRAIAEERHAFMVGYFEQLEAEVRGER